MWWFYSPFFFFFCCVYPNVDESPAFEIGKQGMIVWTGVKISFLCKLLYFCALFWSYYACCLEPFYALIFGQSVCFMHCYSTHWPVVNTSCVKRFL
jgi:hypothetical protein